MHISHILGAALSTLLLFLHAAADCNELARRGGQAPDSCAYSTQMRPIECIEKTSINNNNNFHECCDNKCKYNCELNNICGIVNPSS